jgi:hypothetical protein
MHSTIFILLLTFIQRTHAEASQDSMDELANVFIDKLVNRFFDKPVSGQAELDGATLAKPNQVTVPQGTSLTRATPATHPLSKRGGNLRSPLMSYRPVSPSVNVGAASSSSGSDGGSTSGTLTDVGRRALMVGLASVAGPLAGPTGKAQALQGYTAGRIPGVSAADQDGFNRYRRPEGKQGGHGTGWSEIDPYTFLVPESWDEIPVSIADLGGTEVDLRFKDKKEGDLAVVVAPVLRFADIGFNANVKIEDLGDPDKMIKGFGPEILGQNVDDLLEGSSTRSKGGRTYYDYELKGHVLVSMTAQKNRVYIMTVRPRDSNQWRRHEAQFRTITSSFDVESLST